MGEVAGENLQDRMEMVEGVYAALCARQQVREQAKKAIGAMEIGKQ